MFQQRCLKCHGAEKQKGDLRLDVKSLAMRGATDGPVILSGKSAESRLIQAVAGLDEDLVMPPKGERLTPEQIGLLRRWIDDGAVWPDEAGSKDPAATHWSFQKLHRPEVPANSDGHPVDAFISARLAQAGLKLSAPAGPSVLIRRMTYDMLGLPPSPEDVEVFVNDAAKDRPAAVGRLIDRLLASPHYGERWARHWLDVVRFAESDGFETNQPRPNAWPFRDYVIRAFNSDKPYDQFIREQLAGDAFGTDEATGFIVGGPWDRVKSPDPVLTANQRADELHDMVSTTASAFLALTVGCARCHNHKFDPIQQTDYYAMKAVFAGVQHGERTLGPVDPAQEKEAEELQTRLAQIERELNEREPLANPVSTKATRVAVTSHWNSELIAPTQATSLRFEIAETNNGTEPCIDEIEVIDAAGVNVALTAWARSSGDQPGDPHHQLAHINDGQPGNEHSWVSSTAGKGWIELEFMEPADVVRIVWARDREAKYFDRTPAKYIIQMRNGDERWKPVASSDDRGREGVAVSGALSKLETERTQLQKRVIELKSRPKVYAGQFGKPEDTFRFHRGDPTQPREKLCAGGLSAFGGCHLPVDAPEQTRRLELANWIASPDNPLTARVIVNRIWHYHFGTGIVDTPSDFGINGGRPSHGELLDWLATDLVENHWSIKHLHLLILTSATYQQGSEINDRAHQIDGSDRLLWRFPAKRLEAESLRDAILAVSGKLDLRMGGPGFDLFEPNSNYVKVYLSKTKFEAADYRRMIYQNKPRVELDTLFGAFDCPDAGQIQPRRNISTTPLQALTLLNSTFLLEQSTAFAERLYREAGSVVEVQVHRAYSLAYGRSVDPAELAAAKSFVSAYGLPAFCRALYNSNEFIMTY